MNTSKRPLLDNRHSSGTPASHPRDPLHGVTLEAALRVLIAQYGWKEMSRRIPIRCFLFDPSLTSSLKFLRKTPWARKEVEAWFARDVLAGRAHK